MPKLTKYEQSLYDELKHRGKWYWLETSHAQTRGLNRLVKKGFAKNPKGDRNYWTPVA